MGLSYHGPGCPSPGEADFIRRLPHGVEYTHVKTIIFNLPSGLTPSPCFTTISARSMGALDDDVLDELCDGGPACPDADSDDD